MTKVRDLFGPSRWEKEADGRLRKGKHVVRKHLADGTDHGR
jgi:hypothetical protein